MFRLILALLLLACPALAATLPDAPPLTPAAQFTPRTPARAAGALVWLHGAYDTDQPPPALPEFVTRLARRGWDVWRFDRTTGRDPLQEGGEALARGLAALRQGGYRRIAVAGHSRGAWIALTVLAHPGLADTVAAFSPAAHGSRPAQHARAMADWRALMAAARPGHAHVLIATWRDDPLDPDPDARLAIARTDLAPDGLTLDVLDRPTSPLGHMGVYEPAFDQRWGNCTARFLAGGAGC